MINLMHVRKKLSAFIHEELDEKTARRVESHLRKCERCWAEYKEILHGAEMAGQVRQVQPPDELWQEIEQDIKALNSTVAKKSVVPEPLGLCMKLNIFVPKAWRRAAVLIMRLLLPRACW